MSTYQAFLTCKGQEAIWRIAKDCEVVPAVKGKVCGSSERTELFLCHSCLNYWKQCTEIRLAIAWKFALERRKEMNGFQ